jgi:hypothetical protein
MKNDELSGQGAAASKSPWRSGDRHSLDRLLKSATKRDDEEPIAMPFGFDTRVVALWRSSRNGAVWALSQFVRRVALVATAVIVVATAGVYRQMNQNRDLSEPSANEFAIADSVIQDEFVQ